MVFFFLVLKFDFLVIFVINNLYFILTFSSGRLEVIKWEIELIYKRDFLK